MAVSMIVRGALGSNFTPGWNGKYSATWKNAEQAVLDDSNSNVGLDFHFYSPGSPSVAVGLHATNDQIVNCVTGANWPTIMLFWDSISNDTHLEISSETTAYNLVQADPSAIYVHWAMAAGPHVLHREQWGD